MGDGFLCWMLLQGWKEETPLVYTVGADIYSKSDEKVEPAETESLWTRLQTFFGDTKGLDVLTFLRVFRLPRKNVSVGGGRRWRWAVGIAYENASAARCDAR